MYDHTFKAPYDILVHTPMKNIESLERALRVLVGLVFLALAVTGPRIIWGLVGLIPLITGATGYCPLYAMLSSLSRPNRRSITQHSIDTSRRVHTH